jgi:hypothetical protein
LPTTFPEATTFEVETRFHFQSQDELFKQLPFFMPCFTRVNRWTTIHYGTELFQQDIILRIGALIRPGDRRIFLGWKGPDTGSFANIRAEADEEITTGISGSRILKSLDGASNVASPEDVVNELNRLGHFPFMEFAGTNRLGFYEPLALSLKIMECPVLQWPLLLEIEKTAYTPGEALQMEEDLLQFTKQYGLTDRVVHDEPPTLLYRAITR